MTDWQKFNTVITGEKLPDLLHRRSCIKQYILSMSCSGLDVTGDVHEQFKLIEGEIEKRAKEQLIA